MDLPSFPKEECHTTTAAVLRKQKALSKEDIDSIKWKFRQFEIAFKYAMDVTILE